MGYEDVAVSTMSLDRIEAVRDRWRGRREPRRCRGGGVLDREVEECPYRLHPELHLGDQRAQAREVPIGTPNCLRSSTYVWVARTARLAMPTRAAPARRSHDMRKNAAALRRNRSYCRGDWERRQSRSGQAGALLNLGRVLHVAPRDDEGVPTVDIKDDDQVRVRAVATTGRELRDARAKVGIWTLRFPIVRSAV